MSTSDRAGPGSLPVLAAAPAPGVGALVGEAVTVAFGLTSVVVDVLVRATSGSGVQAPVVGRRAPPALPATAVVDVALGLGWTAAVAAGRVARAGMGAAVPVLGVVVAPPLLPRSLSPAMVLDRAARAWRSDRPAAVQVLSRWSGSVVPDVVGVVFELLDVDRLVAVVIDRLDVAALVDSLVARLDLDAVAADMVGRMDLQGLVRASLEEMDLDELVHLALSGTDLSRAAAEALAGLDVDRVVADAVAAIDVDRLVEQVLARIDLTTVVVEKVELGRVVNDALDQLDLTQLVLRRVDVGAVAEFVIEAIDLPGIIRESTGSIASETVRGIRLQSVDADRAVSRFVDRMMLRRTPRRTDAPPEPG